MDLNNEYIAVLRINLDKLIAENLFENKYIILFGANTPGDEVINYLKQHDIYVKCIIDNNPLNNKKKMLGVPIFSPNEILGVYREDAMILVCSRYYSEMKSQLEKMGYSDKKHIFRVLDMQQNTNYSLSEAEIINQVDKINQGYKIYERILKTYQGKVKILVSPVKANGDAYIIGSYIKAYLRRNHIKNYVLTVIGRACYKVAKMFSIRHVECITQQETDDLIRFKNIVGESNIEVLQPYYVYTSILRNLENYNDLNFGDFYKYCIFDLKEKDLPKPPSWQDGQEESLSFELAQLKKGKTVILSPYANSLPQINWDFWTQLAEKLCLKGYMVCTNSIGAGEPCVPGTTPIFFEINHTVPVLEYAGFFVALRSGMCEVASSAKCKQVILYPDKAAGFGKVINSYGIRGLGLSHEVEEIEFEEDLDKMLALVFNKIEGK